MTADRISVGDPNLMLPLRARIYAEPGIADAVSRTYGLRYEPLGLAVEGVAMPMYRSSRLGRRRVMLAPFNFQPICQHEGGRIAHALIARARDDGATTSAIIKLHHRLPEEIVAEHDLSMTAESVETLLALGSDPDSTVAKLPKKQRWKPRKAETDAESAGIKIIDFKDNRNLDKFYDIMVTAYRDKHRMLPQPLSLFQRLFAASQFDRGCDGLYAWDTNAKKMLGGIILIKDETQWSYGWAANETDRRTEALGIGTLLVGQAIKMAAAQNIPLFSFGVSPVTHEKLRLFKRNWGACEHTIYTYAWREQLKPVDLHRGFGAAKAVIAHTPRKVIKAISPYAVKWLA